MLKDDKNVLLNVRDLTIEFRNKGKKFQAVKGANFDIYKQEIFGLVGESGSGKTTIGRAIAGVQPLADGSIYLDNQLVAGNPTSLFKLNKEMHKKIKLIESKYAVNSHYFDKIILNLKNSYEKYKDEDEAFRSARWRKVFSSAEINLVHRLTKDNLRYINDIIKDFRRINQFVAGIHEYIPQISIQLEESVLAKNEDTLDIIIRLKDKMSLDFFDLEEIRKKIKFARKNKDATVFLDLMEFIFSKLKLIKENDDRIFRRIKIATTLEEQNLDLSAPSNKREKLIEKYQNQLNNVETLTKRQTNTISELIEYLQMPSIDELVSQSYLFSKPTKEQKRANRKNIQMIFQDPGSSLNERMSVEEVIAEGLENFTELYKSEEARLDYVSYFNELNPDNQITLEQIEKDDDVKKHIILKLVRSVGLLPEHLSRYPHEFSGGQKQRIGIARSLALKPKIIIADEPISALDVSIRAQVLNLFQLFKKEYDLTYLFVTHDLSVVKFIADRIAVIYHGDIVELAQAEELFKNPLHPYTRSLLSAIPQPDPSYNFDESLIVYDPKEEHSDYIFDTPEFVEVSENHFVLANKRELKEIQKIIKK